MSVRKSMTHKHRKEPRPRLISLLTSLWGMTMLNAELKSTHNILTELSLECVRMVWRAVLMVSYVEWFARYAKWCKSRSDNHHLQQVVLMI